MTASDPLPPCLQIPVATHGPYSLITTTAWREFDNAIAEWRIERLRSVGFRPISPEEMTERKRAKQRATKKTNARPPGAGCVEEYATAPNRTKTNDQEKKR